MICNTCPRTTDGAAQCDRCLLRYAHRVQGVHQRTARPPVFFTESQQEKGIIDQVTRAVLDAKQQALKGYPKAKRKYVDTKRSRGKPLAAGESEGGWTVLVYLGEGVYRVRCPHCPALTNKTRTAMVRHAACRSCSRKQGKRGSVTR